jgi:D-alanine-D-alanine ligase-like ATP-grasp enzyme
LTKTFKRVTVVHEAIELSSADAGQLDTLDQAAKVAAALSRSGYDVTCATVSSSAEIDGTIAANRPDAVFTLIESLLGRDEFCTLGIHALEKAGVPFTGSRYDGATATTDKVLCKTLLDAGGIPTPDWLTAADLRAAALGRRLENRAARLAQLARRQVIAKPIFGGGAYAITNDSVFEFDGSSIDLAGRLCRLAREFEQEFFVEEFIDGREYKIGAIPGPGGHGLEILPPTEIDFDHLPDGAPRIITSDIAWDRPGAPEVFFRDGRATAGTHGEARLRTIVTKVAATLAISPSFRLDIRVDSSGKCWVTDVNFNCSVSDESSLYNSAELIDMSYDEFIERILLGVQ